MDAAAAHLLDFSKPFDCSLLDQIVSIAMDGANTQRQAANEFLVRIKDHPDMWKRVDAILESSKQLTSKVFALQVLAETIETKWKIIPLEQREGIRNYIVGKIISLSTNAESMKAEHMFLSRLNLVLVQILKQDWPQNWPTFISDLVMASKTSETLCENNMVILKLLSEEVFDFSKDNMTSTKAKSLKESLNEEFGQVFQLCEFVLEASQKKSLILSTLATMQRFLSWIPLGYIFETGVVAALLNKFFPDPIFRTASLDCLTEIAALPLADIPPDYRLLLIGLLGTFVQQLQVVLPIDVDLREAYEQSTEEDQLFVQRLALFLSSFLKAYLTIFDDEASSTIIHPSVITSALRYMILVSTVKDEEVFKTCLEFWSEFAKYLYHKSQSWNEKASAASLHMPSSSMFSSNGFGASLSSPYSIFNQILHDLRIVLIDHMAKPEEVIIVEDENGDIVREQTKDTEVIAQYNTMHEALVFLTNLNSDDTQAIMLDKLDLQVSGGQFSWNGLNTLCWAIGSVSGAMAESEEKRFLVSVIKDLLRLCEEVRGKDNKAVVASNIMYIVGQYPRFLKAHWKFLKTVVNKLFEFMHEHHPGVQDMACDTFLKIAGKCKRKFMTLQTEETVPFIVTLVGDLPKHMVDLQPHQVQAFYEAVGTMLSDYGSEITITRSEVLLRLMEGINASWKAILSSAASDVQSLLVIETVRELQRIFKTSIRICSAVGTLFIHQLSTMYLDALQIYRFYSEQIIAAVAANGQLATRWTLYKALRQTKGEIIELMTTFFEVSGAAASLGPAASLAIATANGASLPVTYQLLMPGLLSEALNDYKTSPSSARDPKILTLFAKAISTFKESLSNEIPRIMDAIFEPTLELITANMSDHPDHRIGFFAFLRNANEFCFYGLFSISPQHQKLVVDSIIWAIKHTERNVSEMGLEIMLELLQKVSSNLQISDGFFSAFLLLIMHETFSILTDRLHKSGFRLQTTILKHLFDSVQLGQVRGPLTAPDGSVHSVSSSSGGGIGIAGVVHEKTIALLSDAFPNLTKHVIVTFVNGCFDVNKDFEKFKEHVRDFLICCKEFEAEDNSDLYLDEREAAAAMSKQALWQSRAAVPGMLKPNELDEDNEYLVGSNGFGESGVELIR